MARSTCSRTRGRPRTGSGRAADGQRTGSGEHDRLTGHGGRAVEHRRRTRTRCRPSDCSTWVEDRDERVEVAVACRSEKGYRREPVRP